MATGWLNFTATKIQDGFGNLLASGTIEVLPTDTGDNPITATAGGAGGPILVAPACVAVTAGGIPEGTQIVDTALTQPANICLRITIKNAAGLPVYVLACVQPSSAGDVTAFDLDTYVPNVARQAIVQAGPSGASAYQLAVAGGYEGTQSEWIASLTGPALVPQGAWASGTSYASGAVVTHGGLSYISLQNANIGYIPGLTASAAWWMILAEGFQLSQYNATLTFAGVQSVVVQHNLDTLTPDVKAFVTTGSTRYAVEVLDANNILVKWFGTASVVLQVTTPQTFVSTSAAYDASAFPSGGLVEYWPMNDGSGSTLSNTATPANPMTLVEGGSSWGAATGFPGTALTFTEGAAATAQATAAAVNPLSDIDPMTSPITLACWFDLTANSGTQGRVLILNGRVALLDQNGVIVFYIGTGDRKLAGGGYSGAGKTHIAVTFDGGDTLADPHLIFYINGVAIADAYGPDSAPSEGTSAAWSMGACAYGSTAEAVTLAGAAVWNRVLLASEIAQIYSLGAP